MAAPLTTQNLLYRSTDMARTAVAGARVVAVTLASALHAIFLAARTPGAAGLHAVAQAWGRSVLRASGVRVTVGGGEEIEPGRPYIFMANHLGNYDIPVLLGHMPVEFRWLAKTELFRIPLFGRAMTAIGCIAIDRADRESAFGSLRRAAEVLSRGVPMMIFPEGTRSPDGRLLPFKKGGFMLAIGSGVPIVPVVIRGTRAVMPKGSWIIRAGEVALAIGRPIATSGMRPDDRDELMHRVRDALSQAPDQR
jgi:1-acyl-sn-glycerol-3-phosphate acyltransferase